MAFLDGRLSQERKHALHDHLDNCPDCSALIFALGGQSTGDALPTKIERYEIRQEVGAGGMGVVYEGYDPDLDRAVAIKVLHLDLAEAAGAHARTERMKREARLLARLSHPNIVRIYDVGTWEGRIFLAMEFIEGQSLRQWLDSDEVDWREALEVFLQAGQGIEAAHAAGIIHRDIKPDNILLDRQGQVFVTDLGLARPLAQANLTDTLTSAQPDTKAWHTWTDSHHLLGTPAFMAPEQYQGDPVDERTDIFGFCASLYQAVYRKAPFAGRTIFELASNICHGEVLAPPASEAPSALFELIRAGLAPAPDNRPKSMRELLDALRAVCDPAPPSPTRRPQRRWVTGLVTAAGLVAGVAGLMWMNGPDTQNKASIPGTEAPEIQQAARKRPAPPKASSAPAPSPQPNHQLTCADIPTCTPNAGTLTWSIDDRSYTEPVDALAYYNVGSDRVHFTLLTTAGGARLIFDKMSTQRPFNFTCDKPELPKNTRLSASTVSLPVAGIKSPPIEWRNRSWYPFDCHNTQEDYLERWEMDITHLSTRRIAGHYHLVVVGGGPREGSTLEVEGRFDAPLQIASF